MSPWNSIGRQHKYGSPYTHTHTEKKFCVVRQDKQNGCHNEDDVQSSRRMSCNYYYVILLCGWERWSVCRLFQAQQQHQQHHRIALVWLRCTDNPYIVYRRRRRRPNRIIISVWLGRNVIR